MGVANKQDDFRDTSKLKILVRKMQMKQQELLTKLSELNEAQAVEYELVLFQGIRPLDGQEKRL